MNSKKTSPKDNKGYPIKVVLGVRCHPDFLFHLGNRAEKIGTNRSAYAEMLLLTAEANLDKIETLQDELTKAKEDLASLKADISKPRPRLDKTNNGLNLLENPQLLRLFDQVKGQTDVIKMPDGKSYHVTYNSPEDLLKAMIYSFHLKK